MKKTTLVVPEGIYYLSGCKEIQNQLPCTSYIFNKVMTGCGATTMFLEDGVPTVLCSPRRELINCKANSPRHAGFVHLFGSNASDAVINKINDMKDYLESCQSSPFQTQQKIPKILTTYDSAKHVIQGLYEFYCLERSEPYRLEQFRFVVDEFQTLFTDAAFRGDVEIEFMEQLKNSPNQTVYLSATPYLENYLDQLDEFKSLPYVELVWPESSKVPTNIHRERYYNGSQSETIKRIIDRFNRQGYFEECMDVQGNPYYSREAVFFVNDVRFVCSSIKKNGLTPENTNVICADNDVNRRKLKEIGFQIGHAPQEGERHPTFTFATKASFEGTDFYSDCAYTYIFSNVKREHLSLDISLDLPQIMGRQRLAGNPFRCSATFFYTTQQEFNDSDSYLSEIKAKSEKTDKLIQFFNACTDDTIRNEQARKFRAAQTVEKYQKDYLSIVDDRQTGMPKAVSNHYVILNEIRALEVQSKQYTNGTYVMGAIDGAFQDCTTSTHIYVQDFLSCFNGSFEDKMMVYSEFMKDHPECVAEVLSLPQVPREFKEYYMTLGYDRLKALGWKEANIVKELTAGAVDLKAIVQSAFNVDEWYSLKKIKSQLQGIYDSCGLIKTAKAVEITNYFDAEVKKGYEDGRRVDGMLLRSIR